jgi:hypothetical protein
MKTFICTNMKYKNTWRGNSACPQPSMSDAVEEWMLMKFYTQSIH